MKLHGSDWTILKWINWCECVYVCACYLLLRLRMQQLKSFFSLAKVSVNRPPKHIEKFLLVLLLSNLHVKQFVAWAAIVCAYVSAWHSYGVKSKIYEVEIWVSVQTHIRTHRHRHRHSRIRSVRQKIVHNGRNLCVMQYCCCLRIENGFERTKPNTITDTIYTRLCMCTPKERETHREQKSHRSHQKVCYRTNETKEYSIWNMWKGDALNTHTHRRARTHLHTHTQHIFDV